VHSHYRPGGVRRVIELATPHLIRALRPRVTEVVLVGGSAPGREWLAGLRAALGDTPVTIACEPALGYLSEQTASSRRIAARIRAHLERLFSGPPFAAGIVWLHNPGLARNLLVVHELTRCCVRAGLPLVFHHHDWWFDNRWQRWSVLRRAGFGTLARVARTLFPPLPSVRQVAINRPDAAFLRRHAPQRSGWVPNLVERLRPPADRQVDRARRWLRRQLGDDAPVWLMPCRLLRRKNIAEAWLLTRWLRPEAWLVTTGGVSSADEQPYARALLDAARARGWRLKLGALDDQEAGAPSISELLAACEVVLLTSLQEGFGLPLVEAVAARRPLIARTLPNVSPDLARFGFRFPLAYRELRVPWQLFDWQAERDRQTQRYRAWRAAIPRACRAWAGAPALLAGSGRARPVPFSRLTLAAQLEVLAHPPDRSWQLCVGLNPWLSAWRERARAARMPVAPWPELAARGLSGRAYAGRFARLLEMRSSPLATAWNSLEIQLGFIRARLAPANLYPLLWGTLP